MRRCAVIPLGYALLGLLARAPRSGYDLIRLMERPVGFFWHARRSQIYPELARLEAEGLVVHEVVAQHQRPDKKVYSITETGLRALRAWVVGPVHMPADRDEFMLKVFSIWLADREQALAFIRDYEAQHAERLALYERERREMESTHGEALRDVTSPSFASFATLLRGLEYERGYVAWCRQIAALYAKDASETRPASAPSVPTQPG